MTLPSALTAPAPPTLERGQGRWAVGRRFLRNRVATVSLILLVALVTVSIIGSHLWPFDYTQTSADVLAPPSSTHPFGTDALGRDMLALVLRGLQRSLAVAAIVTVISTAIGTVVGMIAGYFGGAIDSVLMRIVDLFLMMPLIAVLGLVAVRMGGEENGWVFVAVAISLLFWTPTARVIRASTLSLTESDFVESARLIGASTAGILTRHLIPHLIGPIAVVTTTYVAAAIALESTLSFLGLGVQPPDTSLGLLVGQGLGFAATSWWLFYVPGTMIVIIVLLVHFIGDGVQNAFTRSSGTDLT